jgi:hypothetical protein
MLEIKFLAIKYFRTQAAEARYIIAASLQKVIDVI